ncbi:MAG: DMT family transporter [Nitrosomonadales bacterium]|nr:MAG: DMT family transporter [Nitrosomonadales bacterium]
MTEITAHNKSLLDFPAPVLAALAAAALFGASTPLAKQFVNSMPAMLLVGILYLGSGVGLFVLRVFRDRGWRNPGLTTKEWPWLLGTIAFGGIAGPVLLMLGLMHTPAASASLLLNLEGVFTAVLAWVVFKENADQKTVTGMLCIVTGGLLLSWTEQDGNFGADSMLGSLYILAACLCWAIDNNLMRKVSVSDTLFTAGFRGVVSAAINIGWALLLGYTIPIWPVTGKVMFIGFLGYGLSLVLFLLALRGLGAARTGAYFGIAPLFGVALAVLLFQENTSVWFWGAGLLMGIGLYLHLTEQHEHIHQHTTLCHAHRHVHDEHHQHRHELWDSKQPHDHVHEHTMLEHSHRHVPDIHHRHTHVEKPSSEHDEKKGVSFE